MSKPRSGPSSRSMASEETGTLVPAQGHPCAKRLDLMNSPCLVRHQCRDNGQRQAGESMGSEASCVASQRPSSQASGPGLRSQLLPPGPGRESCNCCRSQARHALQKALANWPLLGTRELERKPLDAHGPGKSSASRKPGLPGQSMQN